MAVPAVSSVMSRDVVAVRPEASFEEIAALVVDRELGEVPVTDDRGHVLGVVSEADLVAEAEQRTSSDATDPRTRRLTAADVMTVSVACVRQDDPVAVAARRLVEANVRSLFVLDSADRLTGVVARRDLLRRYLRPNERNHVDVPVPARTSAAVRSNGQQRGEERRMPAVLVGIAGVEGEDARVVAWAAEEATRRGLPLRLVHVIAPQPYEMPFTLGGQVLPLDDAALREAARTSLDEAVAQVRTTHPELAVTASLADGRPEAVLRAESARAAMLVVGAHRHGALAEAVLGSTAGDMSVSAKCPVVAVPVDEQRSSTAGPVVLGVDDAETSRAAAEFAFAEASWRGVELHAVHCWPGPPALSEGLPEPQDHELVLTGALSGLAGRYPDVTVHALSVNGEAPTELLHRSQGAALLVVGTHGRRRVGAVILGSVSRQLLRSATCPVAVVRTHS
ncbi:universal stress protein [Streptoalloteichus hindustanus]|uniref:CBS domain-containing protein n=1 Tax=Streptoalloteichus hindustanus TaxID=2017 RepID=A0A1M5FRR3_STRHI|nr:universal stress protein [Streptoalloteichus hindustanus]SHF94240.1 CBS domain-containing protein [Streptoalloteichus hindustanus]